MEHAIYVANFILHFGLMQLNFATEQIIRKDIGGYVQ
jgi:hypothetical protein